MKISLCTETFIYTKMFSSSNKATSTKQSMDTMLDSMSTVICFQLNLPLLVIQLTLSFWILKIRSDYQVLTL